MLAIAEARSYQRSLTDIFLSISTRFSGRPFMVQADNISPRGAFLRSPRTLDPGEIITVVAVDPLFRPVFAVDADVIWADGQGGCGVQFQQDVSLEGIL